MTLKMLDLCSGLGGASSAQAARGWDVTRVELDRAIAGRSFQPANVNQVVADIRTFDPAGQQFDFVWASPPCTEFARESMPWCRTGKEPDMRLLFACVGLIATIRPKWWAIENVRGAVPWFTPWLGPPRAVANPVFVWGQFPQVTLPRLPHRKEKLDSSRKAERSLIPFEVSEAFAIAIERAEGITNAA